MGTSKGEGGLGERRESVYFGYGWDYVVSARDDKGGETAPA